ncbi:uncharacterized protein LOC123877105 [Maniola jurtina]|uniref:uncharacterized protein LOC123877105 n=1 Tax=Maniola jurtina TaxID=191418 RepID=UPI001E687AC8|nr:uncharacterized protein LOC123877105 [Maniola jurtina]
MWKLVLSILSVLVCFSEAYKILLVAPTPSKSHDILNQGLIRHLTKAGHEVTYIAIIPQESPLPGVTVVDISDAYYLTDSFVNVQDIMDKKFDIHEVTGFLPYILRSSKVAIEHPSVHKLMADKTQEFDLVIAEFLFNAVYAGFSGLYNCPLVWFSPTVPNWMVLELIDEATNPAYSVGVSSTSVPPLTFIERVAELGSIVFRKLIQILWSLRFDNDMYEKNFVPFIRQRRSTVPTFESLAYNGSLMLSNYHYSMGATVRAPQNLISIGGFHIDLDVTPLPKDLQKLMDDAKDGAIYFSLGSNMKSKHLASEIKRDLLKMFGKLKQTVLWKFEGDLPNRPNNVHLVQWAPQQSILAHKNCIIFITHGGLLSTTEALHFGVPIIGIPGFYDQFINIQRTVNMGFAKKVDLTYSILELAIQDILEDPKYTTKAHELSEIYHDRPVPPGKELVHWVEHVIKTRGALHLRSPAFLTPWYQKLYLDLILVVLILVLVLKYAFQFMCSTKSKLVTKGKEKKNKMWKTVLFILTILVCFSKAYKILLVSPTPSKSHDILNHGLIRHLTEAGHKITYIAICPQEKRLPGVTVVDISDAFTPSDDLLNVQHIMNKRFDINEVTGFLPLILEINQKAIEHPNVQKLIADKSQEFDLVISEFLFSNINAGFSGLYNCPLIWFSPSIPNWMVLELIDEATNPAYSVGVASTSIPPLTFIERVAELGSLVFRKLVQILWSSRLDNDIYEKNFVPFIRQRRSTVPTFESLAYNGSLVLSNYHHSMGITLRAPPNFISIGGFHIDQNVKPLPKDLQKIMDEAKQGVIYFSLGSNMKSKHFPSEIKRDLLKMFGKLKQTVLWKFEEDLPNRPNNVHIVQWAPQQSILAHKNCTIFITHGGLLSTTEAIHFGVPTIGIPGYYDQFMNVKRSANMGFAKKVDLTYSIVKDLELAIQDVLENPNYTSKAQELSKIYHDRTVPPGKELVHWVEHVIRTRGALHLRSPAFLTPWYQKLYLDLGFLLLSLALVLKYAFRLTCTKTKGVTKGKQKKN